MRSSYNQFFAGDSVCEVGDASSPAPPTTPAPTTPGPRQSGSLVTHHDDVVTRMKNIQMIELGRHRIKPWYFSPYPQVSIVCQNHEFRCLTLAYIITGVGSPTVYLYMRVLSQVPEK